MGRFSISPARGSGEHYSLPNGVLGIRIFLWISTSKIASGNHVFGYFMQDFLVPADGGGCSIELIKLPLATATKAVVAVFSRTA